MGFTDQNVQSLFILEGLLICGLGIFIGLVMGIVLYLLQLYVGIVRIGEGFIIEAYPVKMFFSDVIIVSATVFSIGFLASLPGAIRAKRIKSYVREE
jgi:ABC-type lipoprotein release transport system permease subunit